MNLDCEKLTTMGKEGRNAIEDFMGEEKLRNILKDFSKSEDHVKSRYHKNRWRNVNKETPDLEFVQSFLSNVVYKAEGFGHADAIKLFDSRLRKKIKQIVFKGDNLKEEQITNEMAIKRLESPENPAGLNNLLKVSLLTLLGKDVTKEEWQDARVSTETLSKAKENQEKENKVKEDQVRAKEKKIQELKKANEQLKAENKKLSDKIEEIRLRVAKLVERIPAEVEDVGEEQVVQDILSAIQEKDYDRLLDRVSLLAAYALISKEETK